MKKILLATIILIASNMTAQTSVQLFDYVATTSITPSSTVNLSVAASTNKKFKIDVKNNSSGTKSYHVKRYDAILNSGADAYFCFAGTCYGNTTTLTPTPITLTANQSSSQIPGSFNMLETDLDEGATVGLSAIKYTIFNVANPNDSVQVTLRYNGAGVGLKNNSSNLNDFSVYPNPTSTNAAIKIVSDKSMNGSIEVINSLGSIVSKTNLSVIEGNNVVNIPVQDFSKGIYFITVALDNSKITKKLIVK